MREDLYKAYYVVSEKEEIVADGGEIPGVEEEAEVEKATAVVVEPETDVVVMNPANNQNETSRQK